MTVVTMADCMDVTVLLSLSESCFWLHWGGTTRPLSNNRVVSSPSGKLAEVSCARHPALRFFVSFVRTVYPSRLYFMYGTASSALFLLTFVFRPVPVGYSNAHE